MKTQTIKLSVIQMDLSPYYQARIASEFLKASRAYQAERIGPFVNYYLLGICIELGMKAFLLNNSNTNERRSKNKKLGHDLPDIYRAYRSKGGILLETTEIAALTLLNVHYSSKSLEYMSPKLAVAMFGGLEKFPELNSIDTIAEKITAQSRQNRYYIDSNTP